MHTKKICLILLIISLMTVTGCSYSYTPGQINEESIKMFIQTRNSNLEEYLYVSTDNMISVTLPESNTSIYINKLGYDSTDEKKAIFDNADVGESFRVVNADTKNVVYVGTIADGDVRVGDFSSVKTSGSYYIETEVVGRSYSFNINDNTYNQLFYNTLNGFFTDEDVINSDVDSVLDACFGIDAVIYAMQCYGEIFDGDSNLIEQLLRMSDELISMQADDGSILEDYEATAAFCGIISMCGNEFGKYESSINKTYRECATKSWEWLKKNSTDADIIKAARFYAAAQLYNWIGQETYKDISEEYLNEKQSGYSDDAFTFYGAIAYMNSKYEIDMSLCTYVMMDLIQEADRICDNVSNDKVYHVGETDISIDEVLTDTAKICFFNYIVPSNEYIEVLSSALKYAGGFNPTGINYFDECDENKKIENKAVMLFTLSSLIS